MVKFWDVRTKNCINEVKGLGEAFTLAWDPEGESLIVGSKVSKTTCPPPIDPTGWLIRNLHLSVNGNRATNYTSSLQLSPPL